MYLVDLGRQVLDVIEAESARERGAGAAARP
jgi:hypothetical protein